MELAPTVLFVYARPWHTEQTLRALEQNTLAQDSILYIYADGAKENAPKEQLEKIQQVRQLIRQKWNFKEIHIVERDRNWGLADNIIDGVTGIVNKHGKIIVLEDDLVTSPYFLDYCNQGLDLYKDTQNVYAINAFQFPLPVDEFDTFLCPLAVSSWGWATWADKWAVFERIPKYKNLIQQNEHLKRRFNFADYDYASMLDNPKSWAIRWYYSVFLRNGLGVFPTKSLVQNIGFDGSGTHSDNSNLSQEIFNKAVKIREKQVVDLHLYSILLNYFTEYKNTGVNFNIHTEKNKNMVLKQVLRALTPPILYNGLASTIMKLRSRAVTTTKKDTTQSPEDKPKIRERVLNSQSQNLNIYWDKQMAQILETWGEDHVWNEIQLLLCNQKGKVLDVACGTGTVIQLLQKFHSLMFLDVIYQIY